MTESQHLIMGSFFAFISLNLAMSHTFFMSQTFSKFLVINFYQFSGSNVISTVDRNLRKKLLENGRPTTEDQSDELDHLDLKSDSSDLLNGSLL